MLSVNQVSEIKYRLNIVDVVSPYLKLTKAGKNYKGLSPFKKEKTPSFFVSPERNTYYCFSTQKGGDAFTFIQEMEGVDFRGALKVLAEKAGIELTPENPETRKKTDRLFAILEDAARFFEATYAKNDEAQKYLAGRGLLPKSAKEWRIGYAPNDWRVLREHLLKAGFTDFELGEVGLTKKSDDGASSREPYDRFRGRIMFPITDTSDRVVAFSGRLFPDDGSGKAPKYLNSPETPLFNKGAILYGYSKAKNAIRRYNFSIMVEGQMDLVMSHQGGFPNTVAVSGTGLTDQHLELLARLSKNVIMAFDADSAGIASA
jgi:DNA primase